MQNPTPSHRIQDLYELDRPRERLAKEGADKLSSAELLAILLRVGVQGENAVQVGQRLLKDFGGLMGLHKATFDDLSSQRGIGPAKAAQLLAAIELGRRLSSIEVEYQPEINSPQAVADLIRYDLAPLDHEELWVILLDTRNRFIEKDQIYVGSVNSSQVRVGEVFKNAVRKNLPNLIVVHNHPSGDPTPSPEDLALTKALVQAGKLLDIHVLDHLIIAGNSWLSLKSKGVVFD